MEWIQATKPAEPIQIITDSLEVATKTPQGILPQHLLPLYQIISSQYVIKIQHAQPIHEKMIQKAHHASRAYLHKLEKTSPQRQPIQIPNRSPFVWLNLQKDKSEWRVITKEGNTLSIHDEPITALCDAFQILLKVDPQTILYFDLIATQVIRHHANHSHTDAVTFLVSLLERKMKRPLIFV